MTRIVAAALVALAIAGLLGVGLGEHASAGATRVRGGAIWADGDLWATVLTPAELPAGPARSFDALYMITNSNHPDGQAAVAEAAPGSPGYNGGRWAVHTAMWTSAGFAAHGTVPVLTSASDVAYHVGLGHLTVSLGSPSGGPTYFECPLVPALE